MIPEPVSKNEVIQASTVRPQTLVSQFLAHTFWPSPSRTRPDSSASKHLGPSSAASGKLEAQKLYANAEDKGPRRSNTVSPPPTAPLPPRRSTVPDSSRERPHSSYTSKWRFLPAFLSPTSPQSNAAPEHAVYTKGDIVCLSYNTLDDRGMRRLEGRSDHRPVIGTYVISL